uniref:Uncharacterized protein n=1 Tax=Rhodnius prolixus TaxID=13249 RepID=T1I8X4_RHOPR
MVHVAVTLLLACLGGCLALSSTIRKADNVVQNDEEIGRQLATTTFGSLLATLVSSFLAPLNNFANTLTNEFGSGGTNSSASQDFQSSQKAI